MVDHEPGAKLHIKQYTSIEKIDICLGLIL